MELLDNFRCARQPFAGKHFRSQTSARFAVALFLVVTACLGVAQASALSFQPPASIPLPSSNAHSIAVGDLNSDGLPDLVVVDYVANSMSVAMGTGGGGFTPPPVQYVTGPQPYSVSLADMNRDGKLDAVVGNHGVTAPGPTSRVSIFLGNGAGGFSARTDFAAAPEVSVIAVADLNADSLLDVAASAGSGVVVLFGNGVGGLSSPLLLPTSSTQWGLAVGDLNGDGRPEIVSNFTGALYVYINSGSGVFTRHDFPPGFQSRALAIADIDGDGHSDVLASSETAPGIYVLHGDGNGNLGTETFVGTGEGPWSIAVADLDGNGRLDLTIPNIGANTISVIPNSAGGLLSPQTLSAGLNPISVAIADLNGDGALDLASTGYSGQIQLWFQVVLGAPSSITLATSPNPSAYGQEFMLTAQVSPGAATGSVTFTDDGSVLGSAPLAGGSAALPVHLLPAGTHELRAFYGGDSNYRSSASNTVSHIVTAATSSLVLTSSANPSVSGLPVTFEATISPVLAGAPAPGGSIQFTLDGAAYGSPLPPDSLGKAAITVSSLSPGSHTVGAAYSGDSNRTGSVAPTLTQSVVPLNPVIVSIRDVPNDQGGVVTIKWRSPGDAPGIHLVNGYRVWRRAPLGIATMLARSLGYTRLNGDEFWEAVASLPAEQLGNYAYTAATTQDSLPGGNPYTAFFVTALTPDPLVFYPSQHDSGYSVDNLAPHAPSLLTGFYSTGVTRLAWNPGQESDIAGYRVYRGSSPSFTPGAGNLVSAQPDTGYTDVAGAPYVYKLTAVDVHGNESPVATLVPGGVLGAPGDGPRELAFASPSPNPARGFTTMRYTLTRAGHVKLAVYDASGRRVSVLRDDNAEPGEHVSTFSITDDEGRVLAPGLYVVRLEAEGRVLTRRFAAIR